MTLERATVRRASAVPRAGPLRGRGGPARRWRRRAGPAGAS